jgi:hypothetical protein
MSVFKWFAIGSELMVRVAGRGDNVNQVAAAGGSGKASMSGFVQMKAKEIRCARWVI